MSPFEFFFSFYGLLLAFSVAVIATGAVKALKLPPKEGIGKLTPLLAVFLLLDIATFWQWAWDGLRSVQFSYGLLVVGLVIALTYFAAASFVFPEDAEKKWKSLDDHYDARKRFVLGGVIVSTTIMFVSTLVLNGTAPFTAQTLLPTVFYAVYVGTLLPCCFVANRRFNGVMISINIVLYVVVAGLTLYTPPTPFIGG